MSSEASNVKFERFEDIVASASNDKLLRLQADMERSVRWHQSAVEDTAGEQYMVENKADQEEKLATINAELRRRNLLQDK